MIAEAFLRLLRAATVPGPLDDFWYAPAGALETTSGVRLSPESSLQVAAVFGCIRVLCETMSSMSVHVYERYERDGRQARRPLWGDPLHHILAVQPNAWQTSVEWHEMMMAHLALRGNAYCEIVLGPDLRIAELVPRHPDRIRPELTPEGEIIYVHHTPRGRRELLPEQVLHVRLFSLDGLSGVSPITYARNVVGLASAAETHGASAFKNGMVPPYYIKRPTRMVPAAKESFRASWRGMHGGASNANNPPILEEGMELVALGIDNRDSQWIESRKFSKEEICGIFRVAAFLVQNIDRATFSNIEELARGHLVWTMLPYIRRFEAAYQRDLIDDPAQGVKYNVDSMLRADPEKRGSFYQTMVGIGAFSPNDVLELEDRNPIGPDGDQHFISVNFVPLDQAGQARAAAAPGPPAKRDAWEEREEREEPTEEEGEKEEEGPEARACLPAPPDLDAAAIAADVAGRITARELSDLGRRVRPGAADPARFREWLLDWLDAKHARFLERTLGPICGPRILDVAGALAESLRAAFGPAADPAAVYRAWGELRPAQIRQLLQTTPKG